jgi:hypothetical protein
MDHHHQKSTLDALAAPANLNQHTEQTPNVDGRD